MSIYHIYNWFELKLIINMKIKIILILVILLAFSCEEDEKKGACLACCDASGNTARCEGNFTEKECADYNKRKVDGYNWTFSEGNLPCPIPPGP
jgi:hypothetical protein